MFRMDGNGFANTVEPAFRFTRRTLSDHEYAHAFSALALIDELLEADDDLSDARREWMLDVREELIPRLAHCVDDRVAALRRELDAIPTHLPAA
jgi:hypothetical protein